jgi:Helix-turn-helix
MQIGDYVLRRAHHWTQRQLATLLGLTEIAVRRYELGLRQISPPVARLVEVLTSPQGPGWVTRWQASAPHEPLAPAPPGP